MSADTEDLVFLFIKEALLTKAQGLGTKLYDQLLSEVKRLKSIVLGASSAQDNSAADQFVALLSALTRCIAAVDERKHEVLLTEVYDTPLWNTPTSVRLTILDLITHAVVANGALVQTSLHTLVYSLIPPPSAETDPNPGEAWIPLPSHIEVQNAVIEATERVLQLVPTACPRLLPLLVSNLPHKLRPRNIHCLYLRALFKLAEGSAGPALREGILVGVMEHLIAIDVDIKWEDIVEDSSIVQQDEVKEEAGEAFKHVTEQEPDIFELEGMNEHDLMMANGNDRDTSAEPTKSPTPLRGGWEGGLAASALLAGNNNTANAANTNKTAVDETADKLDSLMEMTLTHLNNRAAASQLEGVWTTTLACFERTVLHTHRSKFTQFLVFHLARKAPEKCCRAFLTVLLSKIGDKQQPPITRSAAAAYVASFLARAAFVPSVLVVESLQRLLDWCMRYIKEEDCRGGLAPIPSTTSIASFAGDAHARHAAFYAAVQSSLYVLCYHMEPILKLRIVDDTSSYSHHPNAPKGLAAMHAKRQQAAQGCAEAIRRMVGQDLPKLLGHESLDPLGSCAPSVVAEFSRQAWVLGFPSTARLLREWQKKASMQGAKQMRPLEVFFPFDPYLLRRSALLLELDTTYLQWRQGHSMTLNATTLAAGGWSDGEEEAMSDSSSSGLSDDSDSESDDGSSSSSSSEDEMKKTRFGSMPSIPGSSVSPGSFQPAAGGGKKRHHRLPGALKASLMHGGGGGSPTMGIAVPGSLSTDNAGGSPWGMSPMNGSFVPMSLT